MHNIFEIPRDSAHKNIKSSNITQIRHAVTVRDREKRFAHKAATIWITGLSGAGKSTIAVELERRLLDHGCHVFVFDGDNMRSGLNRDLGFSVEDRQENIRRIAEVAKLFNMAGGIAIASFITPFEELRQLARSIIGEHYIEVYLDVTVEDCVRRDPKGLYKKAFTGEIQNFTGISSPFEKANGANLAIDTTKCTPGEAVDEILQYLEQKRIFHLS